MLSLSISSVKYYNGVCTAATYSSIKNEMINDKLGIKPLVARDAALQPEGTERKHKAGALRPASGLRRGCRLIALGALGLKVKGTMTE